MSLHSIRRPLLAIAAFGVLATDAPLLAQGKTEEDGKLICRREASAGSRLEGRTCLTPAQWRERELRTGEVNETILADSERNARTEPLARPIQGQIPR